MIVLKQKGDFRKLSNFFEKTKKIINISKLDKYGALGVEALKNSTPRKTGLTANSWDYAITNRDGIISLSFYNTNIQNGENIAILLQYGHGTRNGGFVQGIDYINPAVRPIFEAIADEAWKDVIKQ